MNPDEQPFKQCSICKNWKRKEEHQLHEMRCAVADVDKYIQTLSNDQIRALLEQLPPGDDEADKELAEKLKKILFGDDEEASSSGLYVSEERRVNMTTIVIGPVGTGKSTLTSQIMLKLDGLILDNSNEEGSIEISTLERMIEKLNKDHENGIPLDNWKFESAKYYVTTLDTRGGASFTNELIKGAFKADFIVYVVDTSKEDFEKSVYEHAFLCRKVGLQKIICCLNKMDECNYSEKVFDETKKVVASYLMGLGYDSIYYIPISGLEGTNIGEGSEMMKVQDSKKSMKMPEWYKDKSFSEAVDAIRDPRSKHKALRMPVQSVSEKGVLGRVESGILKIGALVYVAPTGLEAEVTDLTVGNQEIEANTEVCPQDQVLVRFKNKEVMNLVHRGCVLSHTDHPALEAKSFRADVVVVLGMLIEKTEVIVECHSATVGAIISKVFTENVLENGMKGVGQGESSLVEVTPTGPIVVEAHSDYPHLGRVMFKDKESRIQAVGVVTQVVTKGKQIKAVTKGKQIWI